MSLAAKHMMSPDLMAAHCEDDLETAYNLMTRNHVRHLPVVDDEGNLVGIISDRDFRRAMEVQSRMVGHDIARFDQGGTVGDYMSSPVESVDSETPILTVTQKMIDLKISALTILKGNLVVGILTHEDLLRVLASMLRTPTEKPRSKLVEWAYNSPVGQVLNTLSNMGI